MVNLKNLKNGDKLFFVCDNENAIYWGKVLKKSHKATEFVSDCGSVRFRVKGNEEFLFHKIEDAEKYFWEWKCDNKKTNTCLKGGEIRLVDYDCNDFPDVKIWLDEEDTLEDIFQFLVEIPLNKEKGTVVSVEFINGDVAFVPISPEGLIGTVCNSCVEARSFICGGQFIKEFYDKVASNILDCYKNRKESKKGKPEEDFLGLLVKSLKKLI